MDAGGKAKPDLVSMDEAFLKRLEEAIEANLDNPEFGVDELGKYIGLSRSQLHRKLHDLTGKSTSRFLRSYRLEKARVLLEKKAGTVSEICYKTGFSSPAYFSQVFVEEFGYTPRETREHAGGKTQPIRKRKVRTVIVSLVLVVIVIATAWVLVRNMMRSSEARSKTLVVLPFVDMSENRDQEYFSDGITEDITSQLAGVAGLRVISRTSAMIYKNSEKSTKDIAGELKVSYVVEGSVRRSGDQIRIVVQLIDAATDVHMWAETYDRKLTETLSLQSEVARQISARLEATVFETEKVEEINPQAYDLFLRGRFLAHQFTRESYYQAIDVFKQAIVIAPDFAPAYAWTANCYNGLGSWAGDLDAREASKQSTSYLLQALALDPDLAVAHSALAYSRFLFDWDFKGAEEEFLRAYQLDPSDIINISGYHHLLNMTGRFDEAMLWWERGNQVDPFSLWNYGFKGVTYYFMEQQTDAVGYYKEAVENFPFAQILHDRLGWVYLNTGQYDSAIMVLNESMSKFNARPGTSVSTLCLAYWGAQKATESEALFAEMINRHAGGERGMCFHIAVAAAGMGNSEGAIDWLERAYRDHEVEIIWMKVTPQFKSVASNPSYTQLLREIGFR